MKMGIAIKSFGCTKQKGSEVLKYPEIFSPRLQFQNFDSKDTHWRY